jgi:hypothetical protein
MSSNTGQGNIFALSRSTFNRANGGESEARSEGIPIVPSTSSSSNPSSPFNQLKSLSWKLRLALGLAIAIVFLLTLTALLNAFNYSVGMRTGILDKLSRKGIACWTTEGQLALAAFSKSGKLRSGAEDLDNTFYFSVPDPDVRKQLEAIPPGSPITLEYHQKLFALNWPLPFLCVRRSQYEIVGVKPAPAFRPDTPMPARP